MISLRLTGRYSEPDLGWKEHTMGRQAWVTDRGRHRVELIQWPDGHPDGTTRSDLPDAGHSQ
jgi:hypothetical protein